MHPRAVRSRNGGFTLVELLVVLAVIAAVSAVVVVRLEAPYRAARGVHQMDELMQWLKLARSHAWRHQCSAELTIDLDRGLLRHQPASAIQGLRDLQLTDALRISDVRLGKRRAERGEAMIRLTPRGTSESFAMRLVAAGAKPQWLFITGGSGQAVVIASDKEVDDAFAIFQTGADAR